MTTGRSERLDDLTVAARAVFAGARRGILTTNDLNGWPHAVPVCYVLRDGEIITPIDAKPKRGKSLTRRRNLERDPRATFLVDRWSEDWSRLGWVMVRGLARMELIGDAAAQLIERYPQYADVGTGDEAIRITPKEIVWWMWE